MIINEYHLGIADLVVRDADLAAVVHRWGEPPFWTHPTGFPGLVMAILAQQVSLESAQAAFSKLQDALVSVTPRGFLALDDAALRRIGFSRQKSSYARGLAQGIMTGEIDLDALDSVDDQIARSRLVAIKGIGLWTADTYLLFSLCRADVWPTGDLALIKAVQSLRGLNGMPTASEVDELALRWRPWRAVAARILWHHYLCERRRG